MALEIFKLVGSIFVDNDAANNSISKTDGKAQGVAQTLSKGVGTAVKWGAAIGTAAVAAGTAVVKLATDTAATCDEIDKQSQKLGISRESYQELSYVMSQNGMDVNQLQSGMKSLTNQMQAAQQGSATATNAFSALGVSATDASGNLRSQEDVFYDTIAALQSMENETERNALANDLFGKSATEMLPLINSGAGSMDELTQKAHDLGLVISDETVDAGVSLTDTIDTLKRSFSAVMTNLGGTVMPIVEEVCSLLIDNMPMIQGMAEELGPMLAMFLSDMLPPLFELATTLLPVIADLLDVLLPILSAVLVDTIIPLVSWIADGLGVALQWIAEKVLPVVSVAFAAIRDAFVSFSDNVMIIRDRVVDFVDGIRDKFTAFRDGIAERIQAVKDKIQSFQDKVQAVKDKISEFIENIKAKFQFNITWPTIKLPHFGIEPAGWKIGDLLQGTIPTLGVNWYAKAMGAARLLTKPTVFGYDQENGKALAGGESGSEVVASTSSLMGMIRQAAADSSASRADEIIASIQDVLDAVERLAGLQMVTDTGALVGELVGPVDKALGRAAMKRARGCA